MPPKQTGTRPATDWAPEGPNGERNLRLAHTAPGSPERAIHGEWYPAIAHVRGSVEYTFPTLSDGTPDEALQRAGFFHVYPHRVIRLIPHFVAIKEKGAPK